MYIRGEYTRQPRCAASLKRVFCDARRSRPAIARCPHVSDRGCAYVVVDDFVGQGGTLANLIGFVTSRGGVVVGATVLTGKPFSAKLALDEEFLQALRHKHGPDLEKWWLESFGFGFDQLTRSEARYLEKTADA